MVVATGVILGVGLWSFLGEFLPGDDAYFHIERLKTVLLGWAEGQVVAQVNPGTLGGAGYAYNLFYGPLLSYVVGILVGILGIFGGLGAVLASAQVWAVVINLVLLSCLIGAGVAMYYAVKEISGRVVVGTLAGIFYMSMPYILGNLYRRMAIGEFSAMVGVPLILLGLWRLVKEEKSAIWPLVGGIVWLLLTHNLSVVVFAIVAVAFLALNWRVLKKWRNWRQMLVAVGVALGLTAWFLLPMLEAKIVGDYAVFDGAYGQAYFGTTASGMNDHRIWPVELLTVNWTTNGFVGWLGVTGLVGLVGFWWLRRRMEKGVERKFLSSLYVIAVGSLLLTGFLIDWRWMPGVLSQMQFPMRWLVVFVALMSVILGYLGAEVMKAVRWKREWILVAMVAAGCLVQAVPVVVPAITKHAEMSSEKWTAEQWGEIGWGAEYLPLALTCSTEDEEDLAQGFACSLSRVHDLLDERGDGLRVVSDTEVEWPLIWYPGYKATLDGEQLEVTASEKYGLVSVKVAAERADEVRVYYGLSTATMMGLIISGVTVVGLAGYGIYRRKVGGSQD